MERNIVTKTTALGTHIKKKIFKVAETIASTHCAYPQRDGQAE